MKPLCADGTSVTTTLAPTSRTAAALALGGLCLLTLGIWGLRADVVWVSQAFYAYVWWAWILLLDAFCVWRRSSSLLTTRRHLLGLLATSSVTFWIFFELLNLRFLNWYYIGTFELDGPWTFVTAGLFVGVAFSTVFIGIFEVFDALGAANVLTKRQESKRLPGWVPGGLQLLGIVMALLAIAFPFYLAPLIWGSLTFILDPWNYERGNRSLLRDFEAGDGRAVARLFLAGLISGLVWESMNYAAPQKWIYTVRGLEDLKLFEMPLLGFLGFPALAFDAVTAFSLTSYLGCGNIGWEHPNDLAAPATPKPGVTMRRYWKTMPLQLVFWVAVTIALMPVSIGSIRLRLERVPSAAPHIEALAVENIHWPRQLQRALNDSDRRLALQEKLNCTNKQLVAMRNELDLYLFKGIGSRHGELLQLAGISTIEDLAPWTPDGLHDELSRLAKSSGGTIPREDWVRVWVLASRSRGVLLSNDTQ
jgi:predicted flap endonuclease-1-like 5' DNA nuclease